MTNVEIRAPFGGLFTLLVAQGQHVVNGEVLGILEAMKMEAPITAPRPGVVAATATATYDSHGGTQVAGGDLLVELT